MLKACFPVSLRVGMTCSPRLFTKKKPQQNLQNGDSHGANVNIEWCRTGEQKNDSFLVIRHAKSGIDTSVKPKYTLAVQNSVYVQLQQSELGCRMFIC